MPGELPGLDLPSSAGLFGFSWVPCSTGAELSTKHTVSLPHLPPRVTLDVVLEPAILSRALCVLSTVTYASVTQMPAQVERAPFRLSGCCAPQQKCFLSLPNTLQRIYGP